MQCCHRHLEVTPTGSDSARLILVLLFIMGSIRGSIRGGCTMLSKVHIAVLFKAHTAYSVFVSAGKPRRTMKVSLSFEG